MGNKPIGNSMARALADGTIYDHVPWYRRRWTKRRGTGKGSWFNANKPHQGEKECARRRLQIEKGIIPKEQIYVHKT
uniref:Uncharacterized protein n=1 Tax=viral metagenome TaxID=1070528 RepID=A0A6M3JSB5_9ZZZZ